VNGKVLKQVRLEPAKMITDTTVDIPASALPAGDAKVELRSTGGRVYYQAELKQAMVRPHFEAAAPDKGFTIERSFYLMQPTRLADGTMKLLPSERPVTSAPSGSILRCVLSVKNSKDRRFMQFECPMPSNLHIAEREDPLEGENWSFWWAQTVIRSDRIEFFCDYLREKSETIAFMVRAESPGVASALPATAMNMYDPTDRTSSADTTFEVTR